MNHLPIIGPAIGLAARFIQTLGDITGGNLGITIILFTILIKLLLAPLTFKSIKSSKAMQDVAPIIKDLQKKYKDDKQAFAQEQMRVYQEYGINPLAGCLPVLIQLPVFLVVYQAMRQVSTLSNGIPNWHGSRGFLWITDLTKSEGIADHLRILVFFAFIFQVIQTRMSLPNAAKRAQQDQQTKLQSTLISVSTCLVLVFGWNFLSAMVLYWAVQAIFSAVQQYFITGWGSLSDIFPFLPAKVEKPRVITPVTTPRKQSRIQTFLQQGMAAQQERQATATPEKAAEAPKQQRLGPDGRPRKGSTVNISDNRPATPSQRAKTDGTNGANGANRPGARNKGVQSRTGNKAIGMTDASSVSKLPPPAPRKSKTARPTPDSIGEQTGSGGS
ncbi:MAG: YidC/Oxa1 family membrane protein insertase [Thermomicrobia bacterium]|nr:YidC/Oxa1 family membrane protein insertase [Thermomicrobia bacterium]